MLAVMKLPDFVVRELAEKALERIGPDPIGERVEQKHKLEILLRMAKGQLEMRSRYQPQEESCSAWLMDVGAEGWLHLEPLDRV